jgi:hypothetical protein
MADVITNAGLVVDGTDLSKDFSEARVSLPQLIYSEAADAGFMRFLGPGGFQITLVAPTARLRALVDGGVTVRELVLTVDGCALAVPVQFHKEWDVGGVPRIFGCLARSADSDPRWVPVDPPNSTTNQRKD